MGRTACTEPQCLYKGDLYLYLYRQTLQHSPALNRIATPKRLIALRCYFVAVDFRILIYVQPV